MAASTRSVRIVASGLVAVPLIYVSSCAYISSAKNAAFEAVAVGDTAESVAAKFGSPSVREQQGKLFARYAATPCEAPCTERLWFENRLSLDTEAWSIELDDRAQVIKKSRWASP